MVFWKSALNVLLATASLSGTFAAATNESESLYTFSELWELEKGFWDAFLYPANLDQITGEGEDSVFTEDVQGRVDITRTFDGRELNKEYIFGLFGDPNGVALVGVPIAYNITQFAANDNIASATTVVAFNATTWGVVVPVTIDTWIKFNADGKISQYDATFRWFAYLVDALVETVIESTNNNATTATEAVGFVTDVLAANICEQHEAHCTGDNQQYENKDQCYEYLTQQTRFGKSYELGRDTLLCREVHQHMVQYRPEEHCPHIGPSGGGYCVDDRSYEKTVLEKYFADSWIAYGYGAEQNAWL
ncbi:hypothetical protein ASPWEDRAFT_140773 [Aspergillus wentii DTO 134E9]|uniref:Uncharacterized protein n=1 Tax=Aspergillus wentii DTO 134E9 TaxID=1073089 RepID=A0A1L9R7N2_ASPWE|nr:uncharacterized protein ASPWEDRAFT_140773 [Aspergillus wentii DTO 134E9]KAI9927538.1 hypothetical protein MW887_003156 [Aspergillus wentii]OJJ30914.1 hypothetical protein ASPWEDRAFT_140773 [Aspergillus wentii DTO 134E9]